VDGRTLYFARWTQPGGSRVYTIPANGGVPQALWDGPGIYPAEVPGRHLLVYGKFDQMGLFARSLIGEPSKNPEMRLAGDYFPPMGGLAPVYDGGPLRWLLPGTCSSGWPSRPIVPD
jgi:hypothetical protein